MTSLDPVQVKADAYMYRAHELEARVAVLERRVSLAVQGLERILNLYETEETGEFIMEQIAGTAGRALAAMGAAK